MEEKEDKEPIKFNMDEKHKKLIGDNLGIAAEATITGDLILRYRSLKSATIKFIDADGIKEHRVILEGLLIKMDKFYYEFDNMLKEQALYFDAHIGDYLFYRTAEAKKYTTKFLRLKWVFSNCLDMLERSINKPLIKLGFILLKSTEDPTKKELF